MGAFWLPESIGRFLFLKSHIDWSERNMVTPTLITRHQPRGGKAGVRHQVIGIGKKEYYCMVSTDAKGELGMIPLREIVHTVKQMDTRRLHGHKRTSYSPEDSLINSMNRFRNSPEARRLAKERGRALRNFSQEAVSLIEPTTPEGNPYVFTITDIHFFFGLTRGEIRGEVIEDKKRAGIMESAEYLEAVGKEFGLTKAEVEKFMGSEEFAKAMAALPDVQFQKAKDKAESGELAQEKAEQPDDPLKEAKARLDNDSISPWKRL